MNVHSFTHVACMTVTLAKSTVRQKIFTGSPYAMREKVLLPLVNSGPAAVAELRGCTNKVNFWFCRDNLKHVKQFKYKLFPELSRKYITFFLEW